MGGFLHQITLISSAGESGSADGKKYSLFGGLSGDVESVEPPSFDMGKEMLNKSRDLK